MIRFEIDTDELTVDDFLLIEDAQEGKRPIHTMVDLMAKSMTDENGVPLGMDAARKILKALKLSEFTEVSQKWAEAIQRKAVPLMTSGG